MSVRPSDGQSVNEISIYEDENQPNRIRIHLLKDF